MNFRYTDKTGETKIISIKELEGLIIRTDGSTDLAYFPPYQSEGYGKVELISTEKQITLTETLQTLKGLIG